tara:strand:+ start:4999 stop:5676 length:678 start_codon:yes stop_codon:yes gene_type:complete
MIILTGASGGMGKFLFAEIEQNEPIIGISNTKTLTPSHKGIAAKVNLENPEDIKSFVSSNKKYMNNVTLVNMAVYSQDGLLANYNPDHLAKTFTVNLFSNIHLAQALLPTMIEQRFGRIIHISSIVGQSGNIGAGAYASSKSALVGYNKTLCKEYGRFGITSNIISLGYFEGGLINTLSEDKVAAITSEIPSKKLGQPCDILSALSFIRECKYLNGEIINLHGGL